MANQSESDQSARLPRSAVIAMIAIVLALAFVAIYANWQNAHRDKIESVTVTRFTPTATPTPTPSGTP
jgi:hypothetical protein